MNIRFHIHDKARYPDGALLDVDFAQLSERQSELLRATLDDFGYCHKALQVAGVNVTNVWLEEPTMDALRAELDRADKVVRYHERRRELYVQDLRARRGNLHERADDAMKGGG